MITEGKQIIPFCAGQALTELCDSYDMISNIPYIADNYKSGTIISLKGHDIPIVSIEEAGNRITDEVLVITSMQYIHEVLRQLDNMSIFEGMTFYISNLFTRENENRSIDLGEGEKQQIPKKIHYCWFGKTQMPLQFQRNIMTWKEKCPEYEIIRWDESNYDVTKNKYMSQAYTMKKWGFVPDYARLDIINTYGGIYLDTDVELLKPLDELRKVKLYCGFEDEKHINFGLGFGAQANNAILQEMIEMYEKMDFINSKGMMNLTASPVYQTQVMEKHGLIRNGHTQKKESFLALSPEYLSPINAVGVGTPTPYTYSIHQYAATWFDDEQQEKKSQLMNNYRLVLKRMSE